MISARRFCALPPSDLLPPLKGPSKSSALSFLTSSPKETGLSFDISPTATCIHVSRALVPAEISLVFLMLKGELHFGSAVGHQPF